MKKTEFLTVTAKYTKTVSAVFMTGALWVSAGVLVDGLMPAGSTLFSADAKAQRAAEDEEGRRPPPTTRSANTLTRLTQTRFTDIQTLREEEKFDEALALLGEVRELYNEDRLNNYEKFLMHLFYAFTNIELERNDAAIANWREALTIPELSNDQLSQIRISLGQLLYQTEDYRGSIREYEEYLNIAEDPDKSVPLRIAYSYYQLEEYQEAIPWVLDNVDRVRAAGEEVPKSTFGMLESLYLSIEDYPKARQVIREMIVLYDEPEGWSHLAQVEGTLDNLQDQTAAFYLAYLKDYLDKSNQYMILASQLFGLDDPYGAAQILEEGLSKGIVEETEDNLSFLSLSYQVAREDEKAIPPLEKAIAISGDGELYHRLGQIYANMAEYEKSIEAMQNALRTEDVEREDRVLLSMANSYAQLNRYDEAIDAAGRAGRADTRSSDLAGRYVRSFTQLKARHEVLERDRKAYAGYFR